MSENKKKMIKLGQANIDVLHYRPTTSICFKKS